MYDCTPRINILAPMLYSILTNGRTYAVMPRYKKGSFVKCNRRLMTKALASLNRPAMPDQLGSDTLDRLRIGH